MTFGPGIRAARTVIAAAVGVCAVTTQCGPARSREGTTAVEASFPEAAAMMRAAERPVRTDGGYRLGAASGPRAAPSGRWRASPRVVADVADDAAAPIWMSPDSGDDAARVGVVRVDAAASHARAELQENVLAYASGEPPSESFVFSRGPEIEELVLVRGPGTITYELILPPGARASLVAGDHVVEVEGARHTPSLRMRAERAWDAAGHTLDVALALTTAGERATVTVLAQMHDVDIAWPVLIDPTWASASTPVQIRKGHTATLLGDGRVLFAGGGAAADSTELFDPKAATFTAGPTLLSKRSHHAATLLRSGKVLLTGGEGGVASSELFDPVTGTTSVTGGLATPRSGAHAARLASGKVLVTGGASDGSVEIYDPASGTFSPGASRLAADVGAMTTLASGEVLFVGDTTSEVYDPAADTWTAVPAATEPPGAAPRTATRLRDGTVLVTGSTECAASPGGLFTCASSGSIFDPAGAGGLGAFGAPTPAAIAAAGGETAVLPDGEVLFVGTTFTPSQGASTYDAQSGAVAGEAMTTPHIGHTVTLLPGGDVLIVGGDQAGVDFRVGIGVVTAPLPNLMTTRRASHGAIRLRDGTVLIVGGGDDHDLAGAAEIFDPVQQTFTATGALRTPRARPVLSLLPSGAALVTGGIDAGGESLSSAEIYDPKAGTFRATASMTNARASHDAAVLPDGRVLVAGGATSATTTDIFDPATESFVAGPTMTAPHVGLSIVPLPTGKLLVVSGASSELYDPATNTFRPTKRPPGAERDGTTARLLPNGKVFLSGGPAVASELFDPIDETWAFTAPLPFTTSGMPWTATPDGRVLSTGGTFSESIVTQFLLFDPLTPTGASAIALSGGPTTGHYLASSTVIDESALLVAGGEAAWGATIMPPRNDAVIWSDGAARSARPVVTSAPAKVAGGASLTISGHGFTSATEGTNGVSSSAANVPLAFWVSEAHDAVVSGRVTSFDDATVTWEAPATALYGHGWLHVVASGVASNSVPLEITAAEQATRCSFDADCKTGFCVDGVCCDRRCDGGGRIPNCEGCSAAHKNGGPDGVCGAVPRDNHTTCFALGGEACSAARECLSGFCVQGVCCDSGCEGQCLSCTQPGKSGICSAINEGACDVACDGAHTLKKVGAPDIDCTPFTCDGKTCRASCASVHDCVAPAVCTLDGVCAAAIAPAPSNVSVLGCSLARSRQPADTALGKVAALAVAALLARRRRSRVNDVVRPDLHP